MAGDNIPEIPGVEGCIVSLEHFNINVGDHWSDDLEAFWFEGRNICLPMILFLCMIISDITSWC